ncbi:unnamed protein product [Cochlearia groenlandica]
MVLFLRGALIHQDLKGFNHSDLGHSFPPLDLCVYKQEIRRKRMKISGSYLPRSSRAYALIPCWILERLVYRSELVRLGS